MPLRRGAVVHHYLDHRKGKHKRQTLSQEEMIGCYISHVLAWHFKMVRYSGFLANRRRGTLLPKVRETL
ncbi:transposase [Erwinia tracheiphila]